MKDDLEFHKLAERMQAVQAAREKMYLYKEVHFTPKMARDYERLMSLLNNFSARCQAMVDRGVDCFEIGKLDFLLIKDREFIKYERVKKSWFNYRLNINYEPLKCFLNHLQADKQCGWEVRIWNNRNCEGEFKIWITVFVTNPKITKISYANTWGRKISTFRYWYNKLFG